MLLDFPFLSETSPGCGPILTLLTHFGVPRRHYSAYGAGLAPADSRSGLGEIRRATLETQASDAMTRGMWEVLSISESHGTLISNLSHGYNLPSTHF